MYQSKQQLTIQTNALPIQDSSASVQVDQKETSVVGMQNGGNPQAEAFIYHSKRLQDDLQTLGLKIKLHEDHIKLLKSQGNKLDDSILESQVILGKYHSSSGPKTENENHFSLQSEEETTGQILQHEKSAAGVFCKLKTRHGSQASHLQSTKDVLGIVASLGIVEDENLSRIFSEYLGLDNMLAIVCKTYEGVKALETYDQEGYIIKSSGLHGLGASIGRTIDDRFLVICLENLRPFAGEFVVDDPQRRLDILKPRLPNGESPPGFLGFAVNMIDVESKNLFCVTASGYGLRETLFYNLFSRLQVYRTRAEMLLALPLISDGALSLDGGIIRSTGVFYLGNRQDIDVRFAKSSGMLNKPDYYAATERQIQEMKWKKENLMDDLKRETSLWKSAKDSFERKKEELLKFLADSATYASQVGNNLLIHLSCSRKIYAGCCTREIDAKMILTKNQVDSLTTKKWEA
ncbi:protein DEFECTIVE IN MERISTEM SILENCING 3-like isoform X2 [Mangifera indica]|uniref:protein DEFECTIVE IN MERISTEM SILENCING 3-like isoform X2 n=1 Tax=Mangifera indica TaxID=29780 RepID=UPI001CFAD8C0|nr:protein DEFECTIVE IN MERISTEM SILENCING 3-like isoform X2 [Mangifera indica]